MSEALKSVVLDWGAAVSGTVTPGLRKASERLEASSVAVRSFAASGVTADGSGSAADEVAGGVTADGSGSAADEVAGGVTADG